MAYHHLDGLRSGRVLAVEVAAVAQLFALLAVRPLEEVSQDLVVCLVEEAWQIHPYAEHHAEQPHPHEAEALDKAQVLKQRFVLGRPPEKPPVGVAELRRELAA